MRSAEGEGEGERRGEAGRGKALILPAGGTEPSSFRTPGRQLSAVAHRAARRPARPVSFPRAARLFAPRAPRTRGREHAHLQGFSAL